MTNETDVLTADFPRAVRGYSQTAVDAFVRQMGARLATLEARLDEEADRSEQLAQKLDRANKELAAFAAKEAAITKAIVAMEQRRVTVEGELDQERARATAEVEETLSTARAEAEQTLAAARAEAEKIVDTAHDNADKLLTRAEAARVREEDRLRSLCAEYDETVARIRRALEAHLGLLPAPGATLQSLSIAGLAVAGPMENSKSERVEAA